MGTEPLRARGYPQAGRQEGELALELPPDVVEVDVDAEEPLEPDESLDPDEVDVEDDEVERESVR